jgi:hypothetical protein
VTKLAGTFRSSEAQYSLVGIFHHGRSRLLKTGFFEQVRDLPLAENRFLQAGKRAKSTKEKSKQCFTTFEFLIHSMFNLHHVLFKLMKII